MSSPGAGRDAGPGRGDAAFAGPEVAMATICPACGQASSGSTAGTRGCCGDTSQRADSERAHSRRTDAEPTDAPDEDIREPDPFPVDEFAPELVARPQNPAVAPGPSAPAADHSPTPAAPDSPAPAAPDSPAPTAPDSPAPAAPGLPRRPALVALATASSAAASASPTGGGSEQLALAEPMALEQRSASERPRPRLPTGIRLVIGRRRKPPSARRGPAPALPAAPSPRETPAPAHDSAPPDATPRPARPALSPALSASPNASVAPGRVPHGPIGRRHTDDDSPSPAPEARSFPDDPPRSHPALAAQARLFDEAPAEMPLPSAPPPAAGRAISPGAAAVSGLLGAFGPAAETQRSTAVPPRRLPADMPADSTPSPEPPGARASTALAPSAPSLPPSPRGDRPVRAERVRVKEGEADPASERRARRRPEPQGPSLGERLENWARAFGMAARRVAGILAGPQAALAFGVLVLGGIGFVTPALVAPLLACFGLLLARREEKAGESPSRHSIHLITLGLTASAIVTLGGLFASGVSAGPDLTAFPALLTWLARPALVALPAGLAGLALAASASLVLARRFRAGALAATSCSLLLVALGQALVPGTTGLVLSAAALGAASAAAARRALRADSFRVAGSAWAALAAACALAAIPASALVPASPLASGLALLALAAAAMSGAARLARSYDEGARTRARIVGAFSGLAGAVGLVLLADASGLASGNALALAPLAALGHFLLVRHKERRHHSRLDAPWLTPDARVLGMLGAAAGIAGLAIGRENLSLGCALLVASCSVVMGADLELGRRRAGRVVAPLLGWIALNLGALALGLRLAWIPVLASVALAALVAAAGLAERRSWRPAMGLPWTWPVLAGAGACLIAALGACAGGAFLAGGIGVITSALVPWSLRLLPPRIDDGTMPGMPLSRSLTLALLALAPAAPLVALGHFRWTGPLFAAEALIAWIISRRRPEALVPLGGLLLASAGLLPLLASSAGFVAGAVMLLGWCVVGALECELTGRLSTRGTRALAAGVSVGAGLALLAWFSAAANAAPVTLLIAAVVLQGIDRLLTDAVLARALRGGAAVAWMAGVGLASLHALTEPMAASLLLAGAALGALLIAALRGEQELAMAAGFAGAAALAAACLHVGIPPLQHPAVYLAPVAAFLVAWSVMQAARGGRSRRALGIGLFVLAGSVLLEAHLPAAPPLLRIVAIALAVTIVAGGIVSRQQTPVLAGLAVLFLESLMLAGDGVLLVARHPLPGLTVIAGLVAAGVAAVAHMAWRAGGRAPLMLAWTSDLARLREAWSHWSA